MKVFYNDLVKRFTAFILYKKHCSVSCLSTPFFFNFERGKESGGGGGGGGMGMCVSGDIFCQKKIEFI